jgi:hypothetical protein
LAALTIMSISSAVPGASHTVNYNLPRLTGGGFTCEFRMEAP